MKKALLLAGVAVIVLAGIAIGAYWKFVSDPEAISFTATHDYGVVVQGDRLEHVFSVHNDKPIDLRVERVVVSYATEVVSIDSLLPAGGDGRIRLRTDTENLRGSLRESARLFFTDPDVEPMWLYMQGRVVLPVEIAPQDRVYFFTVKGEGPEKEIEVINHQERPLEVLGVTSTNPLFAVELQEIERSNRYRLAVSLDPATPLGRHRSTITVTTDSPEYASLEIQALAIVEDIVSTSLSRVDFPKVLYDALDREVISRKIVLVKKHEGVDFRVIRATTDVPFLSVRIVPHRPGESYNVIIKIEQSKAEKGQFEGTLLIETNDPQYPELVLPITGTIV